MNFDFNQLSTEDIKMCKEFAIQRVEEKDKDHKEGDIRASYSYGEPAPIDRRPMWLKIEDAFIGTLAEYIGSIVMRCDWKKEMAQYKGNNKPDLSTIFRKKLFRCEVRGTRSKDTFVYRPHKDRLQPDDLFFGVMSLPKGPICRVGHAFFGDIQKIIPLHPEWKGKCPGKPYYEVPIQYLSDDFSEFGN